MVPADGEAGEGALDGDALDGELRRVGEMRQGAAAALAMGWARRRDPLGRARPDDLDEANLRRAMGYGTVLASFNVEEFGTERVSRLRREEIDERFEALRRMTQFEGLPAPRD